MIELNESKLGYLLYDLVSREIGKSHGYSQSFTFMIDESASEKKPKPV